MAEESRFLISFFREAVDISGNLSVSNRKVHPVVFLFMTSFMLDVPCCSGKACPRNSQRGLIFDRDRLPCKCTQSAAIERQTSAYPRSSSLAPIFSTSARLNSLVKPVTTWLLLNLSEQAYHFLFVSNAEDYSRSNTNAISSKCRADHAAASAVTEELIVAQSHQNHKTDEC